MSSYIKYFTMMTLVALAMGTLSCGKKTKSDGAVVTVNPKKPVVITGKFTFSNHGNTVEVAGPWFRYSVNVENNTDDTFVIVSMVLEVSGVGSSGTFTTTTMTFDPAQENFTLLDGTQCNFLTFGFWDKNQSNGLKARNGIVGCDPPAAVDQPDTFYSSGNPNSGDSSSIHYQAKIKLIGWFGTYAEATERFEKTIHFSTQ